MSSKKVSSPRIADLDPISNVFGTRDAPFPPSFRNRLSAVLFPDRKSLIELFLKQDQSLDLFHRRKGTQKIPGNPFAKIQGIGRFMFRFIAHRLSSIFPSSIFRKAQNAQAPPRDVYDSRFNVQDSWSLSEQWVAHADFTPLNLDFRLNLEFVNQVIPACTYA